MEKQPPTPTEHFTREEIEKIYLYIHELRDCKEMRTSKLFDCCYCDTLEPCANPGCTNRVCNDCSLLYHCNQCEKPLCRDCGGTDFKFLYLTHPLCNPCKSYAKEDSKKDDQPSTTTTTTRKQSNINIIDLT